MKQLTLLFLRDNDKILLAMKKRGFGAGRWNGVGGKLDEGENIEQAMIRETEEEIGVTPVDYTHVADILFHELHDGLIAEMHVSVFTATKWQGEPSESEEMAPQWFDLSEIPYQEMWPDDPHWLPQVLAGKKLRAQFELDENDGIMSKQVTEVDEL